MNTTYLARYSVYVDEKHPSVPNSMVEEYDRNNPFTTSASPFLYKKKKTKLTFPQFWPMAPTRSQKQHRNNTEITSWLFLKKKPYPVQHWTRLKECMEKEGE